jgi:hypothetical protein
MAGLADQAIRLKRTRWKDPQILAEELFLILLQDQANDPGPTNITFPDDSNTQAPFEIIPDPLDGFLLPDLELPLPNPNPAELEQDAPEEVDQAGTRRRKRTKTITQVLRTVMPGVVTDGSGDTYACTLYPNGPDEDGVAVTGVKQLQIDSGETIPTGTWGMVFRFTRYKIITTEVVELGAGTQVERVISKTTRVKVVKRSHCMQIPVWLSDV